MKIADAVLGACAGVACAQSITTDIPACGSTCVNNMLAQASQLGCPRSMGDDTVFFKCLCTNKDFSYGIRDCSIQYCTDPKMAQDTINWGINLCAGLGVQITSIVEHTTIIAPATTQTVTTTTESTEVDTRYPGGSIEGVTTNSVTVPTSVASVTEATIAGGEVITFTSDFDSTVTSGSTTYTTTGVSTIVSSVVPVEVSTAVSNPSTSVSNPSTSVSNPSGEITSVKSAVSATGHAKSKTTSGPAAQKTAGPVGIMCAAGLVAMLL